MERSKRTILSDGPLFFIHEIAVFKSQLKNQGYFGMVLLELYDFILIHTWGNGYVKGQL